MILLKSKKALDKINRSFFLLGSLRSGTTITSRLIASCKNVAYLYEQTTTDLLIALLHKKKIQNEFRIIFENYVFDEFFYNYLNGRNFNFNKDDQSYIRKSKSTRELKEFKNRISKLNLSNKSFKYKILINMKGLLIFKNLKKFYPRSKFVILIRNLDDISYSVFT